MLEIIGLIAFAIVAVIAVLFGVRAKKASPVDTIQPIIPAAPQPSAVRSKRRRNTTGSKPIRRHVRFAPEVQFRTIRQDLPVGLTSKPIGIISETAEQLYDTIVSEEPVDQNTSPLPQTEPQQPPTTAAQPQPPPVLE